MTARTRYARIHALLRRMQAVLDARRMVRACFPPLMAAQWDIRLRLIGMHITDEIRRMERGV